MALHNPTTPLTTTNGHRPRPCRPRPRGGPPTTPPRLLTAVLLSALALTGAAIVALAPAAGAAPPAEPACAQGSFWAWGEAEYRAPVSAHAARHVARERCLQLPADREVHSFANRTGHPVTVYQDPDCDTHAEFSTQSNGSQTPRAPYVVRAITIWDH
jgi:hypothetical protein